MARCDCAGGRCSCALIPGDGVVITGSGEAANPYQISAVGQSITGKLTVSDTQTLDLSRSGEGTENEPYNINGVVRISPLLGAGANIILTGNGTMDEPYIIAANEADEITGLIQQGLNVTITGTGTTADPYVINATDGGPATSIAGLITAGANVTLTGAGTTADPYVIAVSTDVTPTSITGLITAGARITLNGTGTTADPYVITTASIAGQITAGTNVQRTGSGTTASPYVISSVQSMNNLSDVVILSTPDDGELLEFNSGVDGGSWVAQAPAFVPLNPAVRSASLVTGSVVWDMPSVAVGAQVSTPVTVPGVDTTDFWVFDVATDRNVLGLNLWARVTAPNVVTIYASNMTGSVINPTGGNYRVYGWQ